MPRGNKKIVISATDQALSLWEAGFFKSAKKLKDVDAKLATIGYNFGAPELAKALERASYLTRRGKRGAYEYIQKGPYKAP
jgi:hypothetical protein